MNTSHVVYPIRFSQLKSNNQNIFFFKIQENKSSLNRESFIIRSVSIIDIYSFVIKCKVVFFIPLNNLYILWKFGKTNDDE